MSEYSVDMQMTIDRVRRAMPRNQDVMDICECLEGLLRVRVNGSGILSLISKDDMLTVAKTKPARLDYQKRLMRARRAKERAERC